MIEKQSKDQEFEKLNQELDKIIEEENAMQIAEIERRYQEQLNDEVEEQTVGTARLPLYNTLVRHLKSHN